METSVYIRIKLPESLHRAFKALTAARGTNMQSEIEKMIREVVQGAKDERSNAQ